MAAVMDDDVLLESVFTSGLLSDLVEEYYQGVTVAMWNSAPDAMQQVVSAKKRGLAVALSARIEALGNKRHVLAHFNRAGVFALKRTYSSPRDAAEHVQSLLSVEYERLRDGKHVDLHSLALLLEKDAWYGSPLDEMHMLPVALYGSPVELTVHVKGDRAQLCLLTHPDVVIATFREENISDTAPDIYEMWVFPVPANCLCEFLPTARPSCFNTCSRGYTFSSRHEAMTTRVMLLRFGYHVSEPRRSMEWCL